MSAERLLERCERAAAARAPRPCRPAAVGLHGEQEARADGHAVEAHRARAADAVLAADVRAGKPEAVAEEVREQQARLDVLAVAAPVDGDLDLDHAAHSLRAARRRGRRDAHELAEVVG